MLGKLVDCNRVQGFKKNRTKQTEKGGLMMLKSKKLIFFGLVFLLVSTIAYGQDDPSDSDKWKFDVTPYFWAPAIDADTTVSGQTAAIDVSFGDIVDAADTLFGLSARVEAWKGKWGLIFDGMYIAVTIDEDAQLETPRSASELMLKSNQQCLILQ